MRILDSQEIDNICKSILARAKKKYPLYYPHIYCLYNFGCRIGEVFEGRLTINNELNSIEIITEKKNFVRIIPITINLDVNTINQLSLRADLFYLNIRNLQRAIKDLMPISDIKCGKKNIGAHIFRHNYIRKLKASGMTYEAIDVQMGYTSQKSEDTYLSAIIYQ